MSRVRLNTVALREPRLSIKAPRSGEPLAGSEASPAGITRREAVTIAGAAAVASAAGAMPAFAALGPVGTAFSSKSARYWAGSATFVLEPRRFSGRPRLSGGATASGGVAKLAGARFPGTDLPANVTIQTVGTGATTRLHIRMELGGFEAEVPLAKWLSGEAVASSAVRFDGQTCPLKGLTSLKLSGQGVATFTPDWRLTIEGARIARVSGLGRGIVGDRVTIALASEDAPTLFTRRIKRRTLVTLERGDYPWAIAPPSGNGAGGVTLAGDAFDTITLEAAETAAGIPYRAVVAESTSAEAKATFAAKAIKGLSGKAAAVPLAAMRYARAFGTDAEIDEFMLAADFPGQLSWIHGPGYALLVGAGTGAKTFEMTGCGRIADTVVCQPSVQAVSLPLGDAIVEPIRFPDESPTVVQLGSASSAGQVRKSSAVTGQAVIIPPPPIILDPGTVILDPSIIDILINPNIILLPAAASVTVTRPQDLLRLKFEFYNLAIDFSESPPKLVRRNSLANTVGIVVTFPPQHIRELVFPEVDNMASIVAFGENVVTPPIWSTIAGESRLGFAIPPSKADAGIPYTLEGLLDWSTFDMSVTPLATAGSLTVPRPNGLDPVAPEAHQTSIEAPWGMYLSPSERAKWSHKTLPFGDNNTYELWHTEYVGDRGAIGRFIAQAALAKPIAITPSTPSIPRYVSFGMSSPKLRAVWARYYSQWQGNIDDGNDSNNTSILYTETGDFAGKRSTFTTITEPGGMRNRWAIVDITARQRLKPIDVNRLMLTSQGAWMDVIGLWPTDESPYLFANPNLLSWQDRMTQGRDHYTKIVEAGRLFPWGHKAVQVTVTERQFRAVPGTTRQAAYLLQRTFIVVREPVRTYNLSDFPGIARRARQTPFKRVEIKTLATPKIADTLDIRVVSTRPEAYWIKHAAPASHPDIMFQIEATDWDGTLIKFEAPMIFVADNYAAKKIPGTQGQPTSLIGSCATAYHSKDIQLNGQKITYAEALPSGVVKDTRDLPTDSMRFTAETLLPTDDLAFNAPLFYTALYSAKVRLDIAEQITNQTAATTITLASVYLNNGWSGLNAKGMAFANVNPKIIEFIPIGGILSMDEGGLPLPFPGSQAGGLATPSQVLKGLSAYAGPFGGAVDAFADGFGDGTSFNPGDFFGSLLNAKLVGGVKLIDLLTNALGLDDIPGFTKRIEGPVGSQKMIIAFDWNVDNSEDMKIKKAFIFEPTSTTKLHLKAEMTKSLSNLEEAPSTIVEGTLSDFYINLIGDDAEFLNLVFGTFSMSSINGASPKIDPGLQDVLFAGPLQFLNELRQFLGVFGGGGAGGAALAKGMSALEGGSPVDAMALGSFDVGPFHIEFDTTGLYISLNIAIPNISVGAMALSNMSLGMKVSLLWDGSPILVDFNFCTKESQMTIAICGWGGGGYVLIKIATGDPVLRMLEIGFWFGASASIDIGVASGSVEIKGGFTFSITNDGTTEKLSFEAYIRLSGRLDILGIIKVSLTFELKLTYEQFTKGSGKGDKLTGTATLTIEIEILFFSFSVNATCSQEIAGKDPRFGDTYDEAEWTAYCKAFAPATLGA